MSKQRRYLPSAKRSVAGARRHPKASIATSGLLTVMLGSAAVFGMTAQPASAETTAATATTATTATTALSVPPATEARTSLLAPLAPLTVRAATPA